MLVFIKIGVFFKMIHYTTVDNVFKELRGYRSKGDGPIICYFSYISFLEHWDYVSLLPVGWKATLA